jgi:hypothetical protein
MFVNLAGVDCPDNYDLADDVAAPLSSTFARSPPTLQYSRPQLLFST